MLRRLHGKEALGVKLHRLEVYVIDHERVGAEGVKSMIEDSRWIHPRVASLDTVEIGEWQDDHPCNKKDADIRDYFNQRLEDIPL